MSKKKRKKVKTIHGDGWANFFTNQGIQGKDKQVANTFSQPLIINERTLDDTYRGDGFTRRVVDLPSKAMVKNWFRVTNDTDGDIVKYLTTKDLKAIILKSLQWKKIFGGALFVMGINDGGKFEDELNEDKIKEIEFFRVYDRHRVEWTSEDLYKDKNHRSFGKPEFYTITPHTSHVGDASYRVHESRVIVFDGLEVSDYARVENNGWGDSYIQHIWTQLANMGGVYFSAKNVMDDFIQIILKIDNLAQLIENGQEELIKKRLEILDMGRHLINTMMIDGTEDFEKHANSVAGMGDLIDRFAMALSAVTGIPVTLLMGRSPAGESATGQSDITLWYDDVKQEQESCLLKPLTRIVYLTQLSKKGPTKGKLIEDWSIVFNPLWTPTAKEVADTRKLTAEADKIYLETGVLDAAEVAVSRFGGTEYSAETTIDVEARKNPPNPEDEDEEVES